MNRKGFLYLVLSCCVCIGVANAAERSASSPTRTSVNTKTQSVSRSTVSVRTRDTSHQQTGTQRSAISISRPQTTNARSTKNIATRTPQRTVISSRSGLLYTPIRNKSIVGRAASIVPTNSATNMTVHLAQITQHAATHTLPAWTNFVHQWTTHTVVVFVRPD